MEIGYYEVEEQIPSERELSDIFKLSRMTVRRALNNLVEEGVDIFILNYSIITDILYL